MKSLQDKISRYRAKIREEGKKGQIYRSYQGSDEEIQDKNNSTLLTPKNIELSLNKENIENKFEKMEKEANIILGKKNKRKN